jgi:hypothetical protein
MTRNSRSVLVAITLVSVAACGGNPSAPSPAGAASVQTFVASAMTEAVAKAGSQLPLTREGNSITMACAGGGSIVTTFADSVVSASREQMIHSSRTEFRACKTGDVVMNGDPYLESTSEHRFPAGSGGGTPPGTTTTSTMRTAGGITFTEKGVTGRMQMNCTMHITIQMVGATPQSSVSSSGTITSEQPVGSTPVTRPCGPA